MRNTLLDALTLLSVIAFAGCGDSSSGPVTEDPGSAITGVVLEPPLEEADPTVLDLCGGLYTACCPGGLCLQGICNEYGVCIPAPACGNAGQRCCDYGLCYGGLECNDNYVCRRPCGGGGEACCAGRTCDDGLMCNPSGFCRRCGSLGDNCCNGLTCQDGLVCSNNTCRLPGFPRR